MQGEKIDLRHRELLSHRLRAMDVSLSEYSFANIYLFRAVHQYELVSDEHLFIRGRSYDGFVYLMPTAVPRDIDPAYLKRILRNVDFLFPIPEVWTGMFDGDSFAVSYNQGDADYVYTVEKMSTYKGRRLHKKRNLLSQFMNTYSPEALPLTNDRLEQALFILQDWQDASETGRGETDYEPCREALEKYEELVLCGGIYYVDGEPAGFILGEELNEETFVLHFAKARTRFKGVYQYMYNNFAKVLPKKYRFLNLEQDLNRENLRVFKSSYNPAFLLPKARISLNTKQ